jgi:hypothetical protein
VIGHELNKSKNHQKLSHIDGLHCWKIAISSSGTGFKSGTGQIMAEKNLFGALSINTCLQSKRKTVYNKQENNQQNPTTLCGDSLGDFPGQFKSLENIRASLRVPVIASK